MPEELFDIVDENDETTGDKRSRSEVHSAGLWHRVPHVYFFRKKDRSVQFLVHQRSPLKDLKPNCWDTRFGGHLISGQKWDDGIKREIQEEVGIKPDEENLLEGYKRKNGKNPKNREINKIYYYKYEGSIDRLKFNDGEVQAVKWLNRNEIEKELEKNQENWASSLEEFREVADFLETKLNDKKNA